MEIRLANLGSNPALSVTSKARNGEGAAQLLVLRRDEKGLAMHAVPPNPWPGGESRPLRWPLANRAPAAVLRQQDAGAVNFLLLKYQSIRDENTCGVKHCHAGLKRSEGTLRRVGFRVG